MVSVNELIFMDIKDICTLLDAKVVSDKSFENRDVSCGYASDLMSDVLTQEVEDGVLLTGLATAQALRTAEMADLICVVLVRGKVVTPHMIDLANDSGIVLISCDYSMFKSSAILYNNGLPAVY